VKVLISFDLPRKFVDSIKKLSPRLSVHQATHDKELLVLIEDADVLFAGRFSKELFLSAKKLKWIQTSFVGVDRFLFPEVARSDVIVTNASGVNSVAVAEHVIALILCLNRDLKLFMNNQAKRQWKTGDVDLMTRLNELPGSTLGIVGLGAIGEEIAKRAKCLGMNVIATKKHLEGKKPDYVDTIIPPEKLKNLLSKSDFVVIQLPLTESTEGIIGQSELKSMKPTAYLVNASRGRIIQEKALVKALHEKWIAGAALDTFATEPLPKDSPLWTMENIIITPHVAGLTPKYLDRLVGIFCENLMHFLKDEKMINIVDKARGY